MKLGANELVILAKLTDEWLDLPDALRARWREEAIRRHPPLARAIAAFTATSVKRQTLPALTVAQEDDSPDPPGFSEGHCVGPYRLVHEIGRGGMGVVWLAEQSDGQLTRTVALKLPLQQVAQRGLRTRFTRERNILASLDHPGIAKLFDAGVADDGQPYMAMQYVSGHPLTVYCDQHLLDVPARVRLFVELLDAVQHAHSALVVHRDLKPGNILVTDERRVMLLDFGIAKLLDGESAPVALAQGQGSHTEFAGTALTLDYASPEQVSGQSVGTRTDIYSLGVVLYELLVGRRPYHLRRATRAAMEEAVLEQDVAPLGSRVDAALAAQRGTSARALVRTVRGDLDAVVLKALGKTPEARYATAQAFAEDLQRWLRQEPVSAQPDRPGYRLRRLLARRWRAFTVAAVVMSAIIGTTAVAINEAIDAERSSRAARDEARKATAVTAFLKDLFRSNSVGESDPAAARKRTAEELLDEGARRIPESLREAPEQQIELMHMMSQMYAEMRLPARAVELAEQAATVARKAYGETHPKALAELARWSLRAYAFDMNETGDRVLALVRPQLPRLAASDDVELRRVAAGVYEAMLHRDVIQHVGESLATARAAERLFASLPQADTNASRYNLMGVAYFKNLEFADAQRNFSASARLFALEGMSASAAPSFPAWLAQLQALTGRYTEAEASFIRANGLERHGDAGSARLIDWVLARYTRFLIDTGRANAALKLSRTGGPDADAKIRDALTHSPRALLAQVSALTRLGPVEQALVVLNRTDELGNPPHERIEAILELGRLSDAQGLLDATEHQLAEEEALASTDGRRYWRNRVTLALGQQNPAASKLLLEQSRKLLAPPGAGLAEIAMVEWLDAAVEQMQGQHASARQRLESALARIVRAPERPFLREWEARLQDSLGVSLGALGDTDGARRAFEAALEHYRAILDPKTSLLVGRVAMRLAALHRQTGRTLQAEPLQALADAIRHRHPMFERWMLF